MKVLMISSNTLPASPSGPAYVAGAVRQAGHEVQVYENLFATDPEAELASRLADVQPDVVGLSIRLVFGDVLDSRAPLGTRHTDLRPRVREIVEVIRQHSDARIVLGGPGFNYYARDWLEYLDVDYGIRGEGEEAFPLFLRLLVEGGDIYTVPGCAFRVAGKFGSVPPRRVENLDDAALPAYELFDLPQYAARQITPAIFTKRGCAFKCAYCPYSKLEGSRYRLKSPERVLAEIHHLRQHTSSRSIMFCDNNFNVPRPHAEAICRALIAERSGISWGTGDLRPVGVTDDFCRLLEDSGCSYVNLAVESASDRMLQSMQRGYTVREVRESLEVLSRARVPFGVSLLIGAPGETPETITETLAVLDDYDIPHGVWVTLGIYMWTEYQDLVAQARQAGLLRDEKQLFSGAVYLSPDLPWPYLQELLLTLRARQGYQVQCNKSSEEWVF
jgi:radical SAM superfamily enzyme YgiQ (UPF0313 family)